MSCFTLETGAGQTATVKIVSSGGEDAAFNIGCVVDNQAAYSFKTSAGVCQIDVYRTFRFSQKGERRAELLEGRAHLGRAAECGRLAVVVDAVDAAGEGFLEIDDEVDQLLRGPVGRGIGALGHVEIPGVSWDIGPAVEGWRCAGKNDDRWYDRITG